MNSGPIHPACMLKCSVLECQTVMGLYNLHFFKIRSVHYIQIPAQQHIIPHCTSYQHCGVKAMKTIFFYMLLW